MKIKRWVYKVWYILTLKFRKARISIVSARLSGNGNLIDIRYRLSRPDMLQKSFNTYLIDETTKDKLYLAQFVKFGMVRTKHDTYTTYGIALFYNRNNIIKTGSKVFMVFDSLVSEQTEIP